MPRRSELSHEQALALCVDRLLLATGPRDDLNRELDEILAQPLSPGADTPVWLALTGAARAWLACGENHPQRPRLKAHLFSARQLARHAAPTTKFAYDPKGAPRPVFERET
ncbi:hypothetical protein [Parvibaculum sp.]|uniref:hypothetical protein n=1 Tax=Parvibaculum sp. TaxID=2024848 RepID=UPI001D9639D3|nr:hypothetical protein [Parvibaculum sp.]MBX3488895.1 hypothetical protein [Parvibaculum sp.]MCW5727223.1 hypothetical protein [Parvibaculum sp.]